MQHGKEIQDLFARYAAEVGRHLPAGRREDIEREIAATLADRLDDRVAASGRAATLDDAVALLKETGHPRKTAASYLSDAHLVGPALYPTFLMVCRVALPVLAVVLIAALTLAAAISPEAGTSVAEQIGGILASTATGLLQAFAILVIVFAVLERAGARRGSLARLTGESAWDPRTLPRAAAPVAIKVSQQVVAIVGNTILAAVVLLAPRLLVLRAGVADLSNTLATLADPLVRLLPLVVAVAGAQVVAASFLLTHRRHTVATMAVYGAAKALGIIAAGIYLTVWPYVVAAAAASAETVLAIGVLNRVVQAACIIAIVAGAIELAATLVRFTRAARG